MNNLKLSISLLIGLPSLLIAQNISSPLVLKDLIDNLPPSGENNVVESIVVNGVDANIDNKVAELELDCLMADSTTNVYSRINISGNNLLFKQSNQTSGYFLKLAYGNGKFITGSDMLEFTKGIYYSTNGIDWIQSDETTGAHVHSVSYCNGVYLAGIHLMGIYYSTNGINWTNVYSTSDSCKSFTYGNNLYLAGFSNNGIYYSTNGIDWIQSNKTSGDIGALTYGSGKYIASSGYNGLYYSTDGITWNQSNQTTGQFITLTYGNGKYIAGSGNNGGIYYSLDGINWIQSNKTSGSFRALIYENGNYMAIKEGRIWYSSDGINWFILIQNFGSISSLTYGNGKLIAGSNDNGGLYYADAYIDKSLATKEYANSLTNDLASIIYVNNSLYNIAPLYSDSTIYTNGNYCIYSGLLYECTNYTGSASSFVPGNWKRTTVTEIVGNISSILHAVNGGN